MNVAVLFLIFNRPEITRLTFSRIREAKPSLLFLAADGARFPLKNEVDLCDKARLIVEQIDWPCEVKTLFQDSNLGCGRNVSTAINWFFQHVEEGIILEDDCLPSQDFFTYSTKMLSEYRHNTNVMMIAGTNYHRGKYAAQSGYYLSKHYPIWGWATWRRAWQSYNFSLPLQWRDNISERELAVFLTDPRIAKKWGTHFDQIAKKEIDTWDTQWVYACLKNRGFCVTPLQNMISNIGLVGAHGNGTKAWVHELAYESIDMSQCLKNRLTERESCLLDLETYGLHNYRYEESFYKKITFYFGTRFPFLKNAYKAIKSGS